MKNKTPDEIIRDIVARQVAPAVIERAKHLLHLENVVKILTMYGELDLARQAQKRLDYRRSVQTMIKEDA